MQRLPELLKDVGFMDASYILLLTVIIAIITTLVMKRVHAVQENSLAMRVLKRMIRPVLCLILVAGASISLSVIDGKHAIVQTIMEIVQHGLMITAIALVIWLVIAILAGIKRHLLFKYDMSKEDNLHARKVHTQINVFYRIIAFFVTIIGLSFILMTFDGVSNIGTSLLASAGVTGIILGFAAQKTLGTVFAGIQIAITQPIRIEDAVVVEGEWGWIEDITFTYVVIRIWDLRRLVVPITYFIEQPFQNWTRNSAEIIGSVELYLDFSVPLEELRAEFERVVRESSLWNRKVQVLQVMDVTEKTQKIRCLMTAKDSPTTWDLRCLVREKLIIWLQTHYPESLPQHRVMYADEAGKIPASS